MNPPTDPSPLRPVGFGAILRELLAIAGPTVAQMVSYTVMQFIDIWMLSRVGPGQAASAGNSGMFFFSFISFGFGVLMLVNTLVSQSFGRRDFAACGRYLWQGLWLSVLFAALLVPVWPLVRPMFAAFGHEPAVVNMEASYFRIVLITAFCKLAATAVGQFLLAIDRPRAVFISAALGVCANTLAAWLMVLGPFRLGVVGAAWGANIGVTVELLILIAFLLRPGVRNTYNALDWRLRWPELKALLLLGIPSGVQVVTEVLAWSLFGATVIGIFGTAAMAANQYMLRYLITGFMPCLGISVAVTALVGRYVGMGRPDDAAVRAHAGFVLTVIYTVACGLLFYFARFPLMRLFTDDPAVLAIGARLLIIAACYSFFDAMYIVYCGALRGASDTAIPALATGLLCWSIMLGGGLLVARLLPGLGAVGPWYAAMAYGVTLGLFMLTRFLRGSWRSRAREVPTEPPPLTEAELSPS